MTVQKKILDLTGSQYLVQKVKSAINDVDSSLSTHIADTDIHVTTADKNKWNNQTYVFRYSSTTLVASSTNSNTLLDNTDNLKVGDKVIDSSGVLFSITAIDTANSTFTVGSALVDLALDANVVHTSGVETVGGFKQFANIRVTNSIKGINLDSTTTDLNNCYSDFAPYRESKGGNIQYYYCNSDSGTANISNLPEAKAFFLTSVTTRFISNSLYVKQILINSSNKTFTRYCNNGIWGSWVNETDKFVTTDTAQTISGNKTFSSNVNVYNSDSSTDTANIILKNSKAERGSTTNIGEQNIIFVDKNNNQLGNIKCITNSLGVSNMYISCNVSGNDKGIRLSVTPSTTYFRSSINNDCKLGTSDVRWSDVQTYQVNGLTPSSLSMPSGNVSDVIDISSYITDLSGNVNNYTAPANGWISITMSGCSGIQAYINGLWGNQIVRSTAGTARFFMPICKNMTANILIFGGTIDNVRFIPCQGNV